MPLQDLIKFPEFQKIARLSRDIIITEKIDGTNGVIYVTDDGTDLLVGSRSRWITPEADNFGFARWACANRESLLALGPGTHYGEWWGHGVQRGYGLKEKRFSLFNTTRWGTPDSRPACCHCVPVLYTGPFTTQAVEDALEQLRVTGSQAAPGFKQPEGVVIFHAASGYLFKKTIEKDEVPKALAGKA